MIKRPFASLLASTFTLTTIACSVAACGGGDQAPTPTQFQLSFASVSAAVATEQVEVYVFDATQSKAEICNTLLIRRRSKQDLGPALVRSAPLSPCELQGGAGGLEVSFGTRAFFAVGLRQVDVGGARQPEDLLLGCTVLEVGPASPAPLILLDYASTNVQEIPGTKCAAFSDHCHGAC